MSGLRQDYRMRLCLDLVKMDKVQILYFIPGNKIWTLSILTRSMVNKKLEENKTMIYVFKRNLRDFKNLRQELSKIKGFGLFTANQLCDRLGVNPKLMVKKLRFSQRKRLLEIGNKNYIYGYKLHKVLSKDLERLTQICSYRGFRHRYRLPTRGQNTHSNAKTAKKGLQHPRVIIKKKMRKKDTKVLKLRKKPKKK